MKTTNWQTKALTLFIAAVALCLATACTTYYPIDYPYYGIRVISSEPCEIDVPLVPSQEFVELVEREGTYTEGFPSWDLVRSLPGYWDAVAMRRERLAPEELRIGTILETYEGQLQKYPHYWGTYIKSLSAWNGVLTDGMVVVVNLDHIVDPRTVPPEDRIPDCIAGVPVHIVIGQSFGNPKN